MRAPLLLVGCLALVINNSLEAQFRGGRPGGGFGGRGGMGRMGGFRELPVVDPIVRDGPLEPGTFAALFDLSETQRTVYAARRDSMLAATQLQRDSLAALRPGRRGGGDGPDGRGRGGYGGGGWRDGGRDFGGMRDRLDRMEHLLKALEKQQKEFDKGLKKSLLTKDQWKRYDHWRKERRKEAKDG